MATLALVNRFRRQILRQTAAAERELVAAYATIIRDLESEATAVARSIERRREEGEEITPASLAREARLQRLIDQYESEISRINAGMPARIGRLQAEALGLSQEAAAALMLDQGIEGLVRIPSDELARLLGRLGAEGPLGQLFAELGPDAARRAREALITGLGSGENPLVIARRLEDALGGNLARARTIARTETLRVYREGQIAHYNLNADVLSGWMWVAAINNTNPRPCPICIALHGRVFPLTERFFATHPNCRCSAAPVARRTRIDVERGPIWFAQQPDSVQMEILGRAKFNAYKQGAISLPDLVALTSSPHGPGRREVALRDLVGRDAALAFRSIS